MNMPSNLLGFDRHGLEAWMVANGEPAFRARQVMRWIYQQGERDLSKMTDLPRGLREKMDRETCIQLPAVLSDRTGADGTRKWLLAAGSGGAIEMVFIPENDRGTLCVSSQVGCAMDCSFCATGAQGFNRNLSTAEIVGQVKLANLLLPPRATGLAAVSNVVFMGMGEPLANYSNLVPALDLLTDTLAFGLSKRRVTVSTSGLVPVIDRLSRECDVALAVSLHAPNDALRDQLVPINRRYPLEKLIAACRRYVEMKPHRHVVIEYVMLDGVNDSASHAKQLVKLLSGLNAKVNLIPFNRFSGSHFAPSSKTRTDLFRSVLLGAGFMTITRRTRGDDISAACGQLAGNVRNRVRHSLGSRISREVVLQ